ncbi:MAG: GyrI-like domain-containing protein [Planctomycetota bacterium]|jgi:hypothetical protein
MEKIDFKKKLKKSYTVSAERPVIIDVPPINFLMINDQGNLNSAPSFQQAIQAFYGMSFTAKFMLKEDKATSDYVIPPLEGLWYTADMIEFNLNKKDKWKWTLMIMQPKWFTQSIYQQTKEALKKKKDPPALSKLRFETFREGKSIQIMHIGPYDTKSPAIEKLHAFIREQGYKLHGKHHEIYLSDPRRCQPKNLKTILRQPVK